VGPNRFAKSQMPEQRASAPAAWRVYERTQEALKSQWLAKIITDSRFVAQESQSREACLPKPCAGRLLPAAGRPNREYERTQEVLKNQWLPKITSDSRFLFDETVAGALSPSPLGHDAGAANVQPWAPACRQVGSRQRPYWQVYNS
jgi:hypothetical protein